MRGESFFRMPYPHKGVSMQKSGIPVLLVAVIFLAGCGKGGPDTDKMFSDTFDTRLKKMSVLYSTFSTRNNWTGPADEAELRKYIGSVSEKRLKRLNIDKSSTDELFKSERDGEPLRIRWGMVGGNGVPPKPILFESVGMEGKFMVGFTNGTCGEFSKSDYDKLWNGEGDDGSMMGEKAAQSGRPDGAQSP